MLDRTTPIEDAILSIPEQMYFGKKIEASRELLYHTFNESEMLKDGRRKCSYRFE